MVIYVVEAVFGSGFAASENPANARVARGSGLWLFPSWIETPMLPKQARYQLRYTRLFSFYPAGRILPKNRGARWMPFPDPARNTLFQRRACGHRRARMLRYAGRSSASALPAARFFPFCGSRRRGCLCFSPCPQAGAVQKHPCAVCARIGPG